MNRTTTINKCLLVSVGSARLLNLRVPSFVPDDDTYLLGYDRDDDLIAWGPAAEHDDIVRILRVC